MPPVRRAGLQRYDITEDPQRAERAVQAMNLRLAGMQEYEVARQLRVNVPEARSLISEAIAAFGSKSTIEYQAVMAMRYEAQIRAYWDGSIRGNHRDAQTLARFMKQHQELLGFVHKTRPENQEQDTRVSGRDLVGVATPEELAVIQRVYDRLVGPENHEEGSGDAPAATDCPALPGEPARILQGELACAGAGEAPDRAPAPSERERGISDEPE